MTDKGISKSDALAAVNAFNEVLKDCIQDGIPFDTGIFHSNYSIKGIFDGEEEHFNHSKQKLQLNLNPNKEINESLNKISIEKTHAKDYLPTITEVKDSKTGSINDEITPQSTIAVFGDRLKVLGDDSSVGVFLIDKENQPTKITTLAENNPSKLILLLPELPAGEYRLQVTTQYADGGHQLKEPRTGIFQKKLTVK